MKKISSAISALIVLVAVAAANAAGRPITVADLLSMPRISEPQLSPDGTRVVYTLAVPDVKANRMARDVWMVTLASSEARALTTGGHEGRGRWSPDGKRIAFISTRSGSMQLYVMNADGSGSPKQVTNVSSDVDGIVWAPDGRSIAFTADSKTICFTAVTEPVEATSTNGDLFEVDVTGALRQAQGGPSEQSESRAGAPRKLTTNRGFDGAPAYSPDGTSIAYRSQARPGYETDKWRLMLMDRATGKSTSLTDAFDRSVEDLRWSSDGRSIYFNAEDRGEMPVFMIPAAGGAPKAITPGSFDGEFDAVRDALVVSRSSLASPAELFAISANGAAKPLTRHTASVLAPLDIATPESFTFKGAGGTDVQGFLVRPPAFDAAKKYPVVLLLHGGPQTQWSDTWSYRWNAQTFASPGYVVVLINRRGSTGFGQKFTDEITNDWGGKAFADVMNGLESVLARYPFADRQRVAAAGASYGGYLIDWLASQSNGRFRALISHAGVYDLTSMYGATEELWFPEHDFGGTPWTSPAAYQKWSPSSYAADFGKFKTPTLVIAAEQDYRVPYTQSLEFYTAMQRQGVPSRLLIFPDEGHWILKPQNSMVWYKEVHDWLARYLATSQPSNP